jgi:hypothetical protein
MESEYIGEKLERRYVRVQDAVLWDENPKEHDIGSLIQLIDRYGFRDPPTYDETLGALVAGNGRTIALGMMEKQGYKLPRGIVQEKNTGDWYMPIDFGVDAMNKNEAIGYAIDHNNSTLSGGSFTSLDMKRMWDNTYIELLESLPVESLPVTVDYDDLEFLRGFTPIEDEELPSNNLLPEPDNDITDDERADKPIEVLIFIREHGIYEDVIETLQKVLSENNWNSVVDIIEKRR